MGYNSAFKVLLLVQDFCCRRVCQLVTVLLLSVFFLILFPALFFNSVPQDIKTYTDNPRTFKKAVKKLLYTNSFYSLNESYDNNNITINL